MACSVDLVQQAATEAAAAKTKLAADTGLLSRTASVVDLMVGALESGNKILWAGNGGSAAEAQHMAAELSGRYAFDRPPLASEAMHVNTSYLTAVANDYGYEHVFSRLLGGIGKRGDVIVLISTSGNSDNLIQAAVEAHRLGVHVVGMTGETGGRLASHCDILLNVPSTSTPRIQECQTVLGHTICGLIESTLFTPH